MSEQIDLLPNHKWCETNARMWERFVNNNDDFPQNNKVRISWNYFDQLEYPISLGMHECRITARVNKSNSDNVRSFKFLYDEKVQGDVLDLWHLEYPSRFYGLEQSLNENQSFECIKYFIDTNMTIIWTATHLLVSNNNFVKCFFPEILFHDENKFTREAFRYFMTHPLVKKIVDDKENVITNIKDIIKNAGT